MRSHDQSGTLLASYSDTTNKQSEYMNILSTTTSLECAPHKASAHPSSAQGWKVAFGACGEASNDTLLSETGSVSSMDQPRSVENQQKPQESEEHKEPTDKDLFSPLGIPCREPEVVPTQTQESLLHEPILPDDVVYPEFRPPLSALYEETSASMEPFIFEEALLSPPQNRASKNFNPLQVGEPQNRAHEILLSSSSAIPSHLPSTVPQRGHLPSLLPGEGMTPRETTVVLAGMTSLEDAFQQNSSEGETQENAHNMLATLMMGDEKGAPREIGSSEISFIASTQAAGSSPTEAQDLWAQTIQHLHPYIKPGSHRFMIQLTPVTLGKIQVQLDITQDHNVTLHMQAENPGTLNLLREHASAIQKIFEDAQCIAPRNHLTFDLAHQDHSHHNALFQEHRTSHAPSLHTTIPMTESPEEIAPTLSSSLYRYHLWA